MLSKLRDAFTHYVSFIDEEWELISQNIFIKSYKKNELLLTEGKICTYVAFLVGGIVRYYFVRNGKEITVQFFLENSFFSDYRSFIRREPSTFYIEALEDCTLLMISKDDIDKLYNYIPRFERFGRIMAENLYLSIADKTIRLMGESPEEKFSTLIHEQSELIRRVPQYMLSSYLGVTPEAYCRIKKRFLSTNNKKREVAFA